MLRTILLSLCAATCFAAQPSEEAVKKELKLFQGKWNAVSAIENGKPVGAEELKAVSLVVDGNKFVIKTATADLEGTFQIDPTKKIKTIDVHFKDGLGKVLGIYQIDGDVRKSCFCHMKDVRPDGFEKKQGFSIFEWKKAK